MAEKSRNWVAVLNTLHQSDRLNRVTEGAELLYRRLLEVCDNGGNYFADPALLLGYIFAHRMSMGLTPKDMLDRTEELVKVGLIDVYAEGKLLHISRYYTRLRSDGHGADIRFASFPGKPNPTPDSDRTPPGVHPASTESEIDSEREESEKRARSPSASGSEPATAGDAPKSRRRESPKDMEAVRELVGWFYSARESAGHGKTTKYDGRHVAVPDLNAARKALRWFVAGPCTREQFNARIESALAGCYFGKVPDTLACAVAAFDSYVKANGRGQGKVKAEPVKSKYDQYRTVKP